MKIVLLHDVNALTGRPDERDGMVQVEEIGAVLRDLGHETVAVSFSLDLRGVSAELYRLAPALVFNLVEAVQGEGRLVHLAPALLGTLGLPYTGSGPEAMAIGTHKVLAKKILAAAGLPTPPWIDAEGHSGGKPRFPGRFLMKPVAEDASVGIDEGSVVRATTAGELRDALLTRSGNAGGEMFAETWIEGREINLSLLEEAAGPRVLPPAEIRFLDYPPDKPRLVGYRAKWEETSFEYRHTPRSFDFAPEDAGLLERVEELARRCWDLFDLHGWARVDFRVDEAGDPWILEANPNPCLSADAGFQAAARRAGLSPHEVVTALMRAACSRRSSPGAAPVS